MNTAAAQCFSPGSRCWSWPGTAPGPFRGPFPGALWLQVRDLEATQAELRGRGVSIAREARQEPWGLHEMHVLDPDGITLIFIQIPRTTRCAATPEVNGREIPVN